MNITIDRNELIAALTKCVGAADPKSTQPYLACVLIRASAGKLAFATTDLSLSVRCEVKAGTGLESASVAVPAKDALERAKSMGTGTISLTLGEKSITFISGRRKHVLRGMTGEDFPAMPDVPSKWTDVPGAAIATALARSSYAMCVDPTRPGLNGVRFEMHSDSVRMIGTDSHRIAVVDVPAPGSVESEPITLSARTVAELSKVIDKGAAIGISRTGAEVFFSVGGAILSAKVSGEAFVPYEQILSTRARDGAEVAKAALVDALKSVALATADRMGMVKLRIQNGEILIDAAAGESESTDAVPCSGRDRDFAIGVNVGYIVDALGGCAGDDAYLVVTGDLDPIWVTDPGSDAYVACVMPARL